MSSRILLIDDDAIVHKIAQRQIGKDFELFHAHSAKEGLTLLDSKKPNLILLDIEMPEINGYQLCKQIRANAKYNNIAIVFLSGKSSEQDIMLGYELGADDYIVKPFHIDVLLKKIKVLEQNQLKNAALIQKSQQKTTRPKTIGINKAKPKAISELAQVMSFVEDSYSIECLIALAKRFFVLTNGWGLNCIVMFRHNETFFANNNIIKPLEKEILLHSKNNNPILQLGSRMIINHPQVSVLIKNMPLLPQQGSQQMQQKYNFYNECLPTLAGAINAKVVGLIERQSISEQTQQLTRSFGEIRDKLIGLIGRLNSKNGSILRSIQSISKQIDSQLKLMDLPQQAKQELQSFTRTLLKNISNDTTDASLVNRDLATVILSMQDVVSQQERFAKEIYQQGLITSGSADDKADNDMEIELL